MKLRNYLALGLGLIACAAFPAEESVYKNYSLQIVDTNNHHQIAAEFLGTMDKTNHSILCHDLYIGAPYRSQKLAQQILRIGLGFMQHLDISQASWDAEPFEYSSNNEYLSIRDQEEYHRSMARLIYLYSSLGAKLQLDEKGIPIEYSASAPDMKKFRFDCIIDPAKCPPITVSFNKHIDVRRQRIIYSIDLNQLRSKL